MSERPKVQHSKCCVVSQPPWVQIPALPPPPPGPIGAGRFCYAWTVWARGFFVILLVLLVAPRAALPSISHVIPPQLVQTLKSSRWNCNVFGRSRKVTVGNYVRNLCGGGPANACWPCQPAAACTAAGSCDSSGVFRTSGACCAVVACPDSASHSVQNSPCLVLC